MLRPFLSLLIAAVATLLGLGVGLSAADRRASGIASLRPDSSADALVLVGVLMLAVAAASLALHWLGVFIVGAIHLFLGGLALLVPPGRILSGAYSPVYGVTAMLSGIDRHLGEGAAIFYFSGVALVLGALLVAGALAVRTRLDAPPTRRPNAVVASVVGGLAVIGGLLLLVVVGDEFVTLLFSRFQYEAPLAFGVVGAALLVGIGGLTLRWSSGGGIVVGAALLAAGLVTFVGGSALPREVGELLIVAYALPLFVGASILVVSIVAAVLGSAAVPKQADAR